MAIHLFRGLREVGRGSFIIPSIREILNGVVMGRQMVGGATSGSCRTINKVLVNTRDTCMQVMQNCKAESKIRFDNYKGETKRLIMLIME